MRLRKDLAKIVAVERVSRIATVGTGGRPHAVPVCHVAGNGRFYFGTGRDSLKVRHLRANPNLASAPCSTASIRSTLKSPRSASATP